MQVARGRDAGADVQELADPRLGGEVADGAAEECPVRPRAEGQVWPGIESRVGGGPVGGVVVLAAKETYDMNTSQEAGMSNYDTEAMARVTAQLRKLQAELEAMAAADPAYALGWAKSGIRAALEGIESWA